MPIPSARVGLFTVGLAASFTLLTACGAPAPTTIGDPGAPITSTTRIASAGVLGNQRKPDESCAPEPAPVDSGADPQRIVALSDSELDALCALGLQSRVVGTATPQPSYLGSVVHDAAGVGSNDAPDLDAIRAAAPDLILGSADDAADARDALDGIAATVLTAGGADWQGTLRAVGAATGRTGAADAVLAGFTRDAREAGHRIDATHYQASVVQFTENTMRVYGASSFPGTVLTAVGVDRPAAQRFTDTPYVEVSTADLSADTDLSAADGDVIYLSFQTSEAKERAASVLNSDAWRTLSANRDDRVFAVNNEVWQTGQGVIAARGIIDDLRWLNAPIN